jgi:hypothetical protein
MVPAVLTVFRYTASFINGDGVWQSVMSVQNVDLFYWGQDRFFAILPLLASPIADPTANLFVLLVINALAFHALLLTICYLGLDAIADPPSRRALVVAYLVMAITAQVAIAPATIYAFALEASPHSTAWLLALWSYQLFKRRTLAARVVAAALIGVSVGLSPQALLLVALLALVEAVRHGHWRSWIVYGALWASWLVIWMLLARIWGGNAGPLDPASVAYFSFSRSALTNGAAQSVTNIVGAYRILPLIAGIILAALALLMVRDRWAGLMPRWSLAIAFCGTFWAVFTANTWTAMNGYNVRYYFPVALLPIVAVAVPITAAVLVVRVPGPARVRQLAAPVAAAALLAVVLLAGPLQSPADSVVLRQTQATADMVRSADVLFVSGYYWDMWPVLHQALADGRDAHFVAGPKSGGDPDEYRAALATALASGTMPTAMCLNDTIEVCRTYLAYWTGAEWEATDRTCPVPPPEQLLGSPPVPQCRILQVTGPTGG